MTQELNSLFEQDRAHFMHPSTHAHDHASGALKGRIIKSASGIRIRDHEGREFIDAFAGLYCVNIGYGRTEVADAIYKQAKELAYYHTYVGHSTEAIIELSSRIMDWAPEGMKKVYYGLSGSDANETQIKLVRYYNNVLGRPQKKKIISRDRGYHGSGIMTGSLTGLAAFHQHFDLPEQGITHTICPHWYRKAPAGMDEAAFVRYCADELEKMILAEGPDTVAAFIGEPVMVTGGIRRLPIVQQVLDSGVAMAGIATALTLEPQLIQHWREGRDPNPQLKPIDWKRKPLASLAILAVVRYQMRRLSRVHLPKANVAPCMALVRVQWFLARRTRQYRAAMTQSSH